jgi:hypothetical protein
VLLAAAKLAPSTSEATAIAVAVAMIVLRDTLVSFSSMTPEMARQASKAPGPRWAETWCLIGDDLVNEAGTGFRRG